MDSLHDHLYEVSPRYDRSSSSGCFIALDERIQLSQQTAFRTFFSKYTAEMTGHVFLCQTRQPFNLPNAQRGCIPHTRMYADEFKTKAACITVVLVKTKSKKVGRALLLANVI
jgi:hypothetical protein